MLIRTHMGVSVDGFVAGADGRPALLSMPDFVPGHSHGHPEFFAGRGAVVMGRDTFDPAVTAPSWPWPGLPVFVLTSRPLPQSLPSQVVAAPSASDLLEQMRSGAFEGDVHLVGGPRTIWAFREIGALDRLEVIVLPLLLGSGVPLAAPNSPPSQLDLEAQRTFPDGSVELTYVLPQADQTNNS